MKLFTKVTLVNLLCLGALPAMADELGQYTAQQTSDNTQKISKYVLNMGKYFGFDLSKFPPDNNQKQSSINTLLNPNAIQVIQVYMFNTLLGASPVNAFSAAMAQFVPKNTKGASTLNAWANYTFAGQNYSSPQSQQQQGSGQGTVNVSTLIDQKTYQQDPVSQAVLNIMGTPSASYCMNYDGTAWTQNCNLLYDDKVSLNAIGTLPSTYQYFTYDYNQQFLSQLNSNSLVGPLMYSTESNNANNAQGQQGAAGLSAQSQAQQAQNFIRYVSGSVAPLKLPNLKEYDKLYIQANPSSSTSVSQAEQRQAQAALSTYFANLRTYAAQSSVGLSNLYFIMSKRLPQNQNTGNNSSPPTSQAASEFKMATWRLYNPDMSMNTQWINQINNASPTTVTKEIALLLAEMNYQMYLERQIQERILLTNSIFLLQNTKASQPNADFSSNSATTQQTQ